MWDAGINDWAVQYDIRLKTWLSALEEAEGETASKSMEFELSAYIKGSWEKGRFWLNHAARRSWAFYTVYWKYLNKRFFGEG